MYSKSLTKGQQGQGSKKGGSPRDAIPCDPQDEDVGFVPPSEDLETCEEPEISS